MYCSVQLYTFVMGVDLVLSTVVSDYIMMQDKVRSGNMAVGYKKQIEALEEVWCYMF